MPDITITYGNSQIATMDATGTKTLETESKYCNSDIVVSYTKSEVSGVPLNTSFGSVTPIS